jgi:hypothetical protein
LRLETGCTDCNRPGAEETVDTHFPAPPSAEMPDGGHNDNCSMNDEVMDEAIVSMGLIDSGLIEEDQDDGSSTNEGPIDSTEQPAEISQDDTTPDEHIVLHPALDFTRRPVTSIKEIFMELTENALGIGFDSFLAAVGNRPLRVATACSGTESPILALKMVSSGKVILFISPFLMRIFLLRC